MLKKRASKGAPRVRIPYFPQHGVVSSVGRMLDCGSSGHRFEPDTTPKFYLDNVFKNRSPLYGVISIEVMRGVVNLDRTERYRHNTQKSKEAAIKCPVVPHVAPRWQGRN